MAANDLGIRRAGVIFLHRARSGDELTQACGSHSGRWYCIQAERRREPEVRDRLDEQGFGVFLPLVMVERRHARKAEVVEAAMFPGYLFSRFDVSQPGWRSIAHTRGVRRIFGATPECPTPVPDRALDWMIAKGYDRPITDDPRPLFDPIPPGTMVEVLDGAWSDHRGICLASDAYRAELAMHLFGREVRVKVERAKVREIEATNEAGR